MLLGISLGSLLPTRSGLFGILEWALEGRDLYLQLRYCEFEALEIGSQGLMSDRIGWWYRAWFQDLWQDSFPSLERCRSSYRP